MIDILEGLCQQMKAQVATVLCGRNIPFRLLSTILLHVKRALEEEFRLNALVLFTLHTWFHLDLHSDGSLRLACSNLDKVREGLLGNLGRRFLIRDYVVEKLVWQYSTMRILNAYRKHSQSQSRHRYNGGSN